MVTTPIFSLSSLSPLLLTKITPPPPPRQLLHRQRLLKELKRCRDYKLTLISAGAGYGKTTLLTDFAQYSEMALCWYSLDESDRDPAVFCRYLLHAVRQVYPSFGQAFEEILDQNLTILQQESSITKMAELFAADLQAIQSNNVAGNIPLRETLLVLDDYQFAESYELRTFIQKLIWVLPDKVHLLLATRTTPQDMGTATLVVKRMMIALGPRDLAFNADEINTLLGDLYNLNQPELAKRLTDYSEGWISAVILALGNTDLFQNSSWDSIKDVNNISTTAHLFEYLAQEVFKRQSPELQDFLLRTSVLNPFSIEACQVLLAPSDLKIAETSLIANSLISAGPPTKSEELLKQLEANNLFVTKLVNEGKIYFQYHALLREFLLTKLKETPELYRELQNRAALVQKNAGNEVEAVRHYIEANNLNEAASLFSLIVDPLYMAGRNQTLLELLQSMPLEAQNKFPQIVNAKAQILFAKGDSEAALPLYVEAEILYRAQGSYDSAAHARANQAQILSRLGKRQEARLLCFSIDRDYQSLIQTNEGQLAIAISKFVQGFSATDQGDAAEAEKTLLEAAEIYKAHQDNYRLAVIDNTLGRLYHQQGRLIKANIYADRAVAYAIKIGNTTLESYSRSGLAINYYKQGKYKEAETQFNEILAKTAGQGDEYLRIYILTYLGSSYRDTERYSKAETVYAEALELARKTQIRSMELLILSEQAITYILQAKKEEAHLLIRTGLELAEEYQLTERVALFSFSQGYLDLSKRAYNRALTMLEQAYNLFKNSKAQAEEDRAKFGSAIVLFAMGEPKKAMSALTESLELAETLGYAPFLPFEISWATTLLEYAARKKVSSVVEEFLHKLGFIASTLTVPEIVTQTVPITDEETSSSVIPQPIEFETHLARSRKNAAKVVLNIPTNSNLANKTTVQVFALNGGRVWHGENEIEKWRTNKTREILFYLLENNKCTRDELFEALWPDENFSDSPNLLNANLSYLRKALAPTLEIKLESGRYQLEGEIWYDAYEFSRAIKAFLVQRELDTEGFTKVLNLYKRDYLTQFYSDWALARQQELLLLYINGLQHLANYYQRQGQPQNALPLWRQLLAKDSYNEEGHRSIISCYLAIGNKTEAQKQSLQCLAALKELDLQPSAETKLLLQKLA
jgi:ATP/maltotriose-dependent transcriptional regulator MalT/DNA-binding SARP family transcriptional activator